jgi:spermidine synthase
MTYRQSNLSEHFLDSQSGNVSGPIAWFPVALLMMLSGFAALGYQIVWTRQLGIWLGHDMAAVLAVVAALFGGLAAGAFTLSGPISRSAFPGRWYVALEVIIGLWALLLTFMIPYAADLLLGAIGPMPTPLWHWSLAFGGTFLLLLPATLAMGATLPAIEKVFARARDEGYAIGGLYASNTLGAVFGVVLAAFVLTPMLGYVATAWICAIASLLCAAVAWWVLPGTSHATGTVSMNEQVSHTRSRFILALLGLTGLLGIGYEVAVVRVLSQVTDNTVYTFAMLLAVYLLGTAAGAAAYQRWLAAQVLTGGLRGWLLSAVALSCMTGVALLWAAPVMAVSVTLWLGQGVAAALLSELVLAIAAFALPTLAMGALFSHLCVEAREGGWRFGHALAANTVGAALAAPLIGVVLLPLMGAKWLLLLIASVYLVFLPWPTWRDWKTALSGGAAVATALLLVVFAPPLTLFKLPEGARVVWHKDGVMAAVTVIDDRDGIRSLHINNREQEGSNATGFSDDRQAWLPLALHPQARNVLFLGMGTGVTAAAVLADPALHADVVELLPEVREAAGLFVPFYSETEAAVSPLQVVTADARRFVRASRNSYDVIIADLFHPARGGSGALYTVEHFRAVKARLAEGGLFGQWLPLHQMDIDTLRSIIASFLAVYPEATALLATHSLDTPVIGLIGRATPGPVLDGNWSLAQASEPARQVLQRLRLEDELAVLGNFIAGPNSLTAFAAGAPLNTDDKPVVAHRGPYLMHAQGIGLPRTRLQALLQGLDIESKDLWSAGQEPEQLASALVRYREARDHYLLAGMTVRPSADVRQMLAQVQAPLLESLRISPDFGPAYEPLLRMALIMASSDPAQAVGLLRQLVALQPARPEAHQALRQLVGSPSSLSNHVLQ